MKSDILTTYIGRQPIFNIRGECFGYELLYRSSDTYNKATFEDSSRATTKVIINLIHNFGLGPIIGKKIGYINVDENMLFNDTILLLPKEHLRFEILEHTKVSLALFERIKYLHSLGYRFSLDDFICEDDYIKSYEPFFPYIDIIKIDVLSIGIKNLGNAIAKLSKYNIDLLAEKIENYEEYTACQKLTFKFFQGYFFEKPMVLGGKKVEPATVNVIHLINQMQESDNINEITKKFSAHPDLVFNLLRHINSGAYHFKQHITNIQQMLSLLGPSKLMSWLGLFLYGDSTQNPFGEELFNSAKFRAKMMEELAHSIGETNLANKAFLIGSLSLIDAYLGMSMENFLANLHLDREIQIALIKEEGTLGILLKLAKMINHSGDIDSALTSFGNTFTISKEELTRICCIANAFMEEY